jgi:hypothetical protein
MPPRRKAQEAPPLLIAKQSAPGLLGRMVGRSIRGPDQGRKIVFHGICELRDPAVERRGIGRDFTRFESRQSARRNHRDVVVQGRQHHAGTRRRRGKSVGVDRETSCLTTMLRPKLSTRIAARRTGYSSRCATTSSSRAARNAKVWRLMPCRAHHRVPI